MKSNYIFAPKFPQKTKNCNFSTKWLRNIVCGLSGHSVGAACDWEVLLYKSEIINANTLHHLSVLLSRKCRI